MTTNTMKALEIYARASEANKYLNGKAGLFLYNAPGHVTVRVPSPPLKIRKKVTEKVQSSGVAQLALSTTPKQGQKTP
jgi:hypothetical protein